MRFLSLALLLPALAAAADISPVGHGSGMLVKRQSECPSGQKVCGFYCIYTSDTCCPDQQGGCPPSAYCSLGDNGIYGCCPDGEICTGDGGVTEYPSTSTRATSTRSYTSTDDYSYTTRRTTTTSSDDFEFTDEPTTTSRTTTRRSTTSPSATSTSSTNAAGNLASGDGLVGLAMGAAGLVGGLAIML